MSSIAVLAAARTGQRSLVGGICDNRSMAKTKTQYVCSECGADYPKWAGQCGECGVWNSLQEVRLAPAKSAKTAGRSASFAGADSAEVVRLDKISADDQPRTTTGLQELDRVLGGGLVPGSVTLIGGDPGIGKSTLLIQVLAAMSAKQACLYVTGEESAAQVAMRARRLQLPVEKLDCLTETSVERITDKAAGLKPNLLVIDSIQTIYSDALESAPGSVSQVRDASAQLVRYAKQTGCAVFLVGHVTKEGHLAGPRVLEHMVDTVLYFESDSGSRFRVIRAIKNRFGAVNELGVFAMTDQGLREVSNPSAMFLAQREKSVPGSCVLVTREGTRPLLVEVQALVDTSSLGHPRRVAVGIDAQRINMLLAVLHRHAGIAVHDQDVYVNVVGGLRISETASDLAVVLAILSSLRNRALPEDLAAFGEIGLSGELRPVPNGEERVKAAAGQGLQRIILPKANQRGLKAPKDCRLLAAGSLQQALDLLD